MRKLRSGEKISRRKSVVARSSLVDAVGGGGIEASRRSGELTWLAASRPIRAAPPSDFDVLPCRGAAIENPSDDVACVAANEPCPLQSF
jgi:hypothetical protein